MNTPITLEVVEFGAECAGLRLVNDTTIPRTLCGAHHGGYDDIITPNEAREIARAVNGYPAAIAALRWLLQSMESREHDGPAMDKARAILAQHDGETPAPAPRTYK